MCQVSALPLAASAAGAWVEQRTAEPQNIECRRNVFCLFYKKDWAKRNHPSTFCGSPFEPDPAIETVDLIQIDISIYGVSYKVSGSESLLPGIWTL